MSLSSRLLFLVLLSCPLFAWGAGDEDNSCQVQIDGKATEDILGIDAYRELPVYELDLSDLSQSISDLINEVGSLSEEFKHLKNIDRARPTSLAELKALSQEITELGESIEQNAVRAINELDFEEDRKTLEGHRILHERAQSLRRRFVGKLERAEKLDEEVLPEDFMDQDSNALSSESQARDDSDDGSFLSEESSLQDGLRERLLSAVKNQKPRKTKEPVSEDADQSILGSKDEMELPTPDDEGAKKSQSGLLNELFRKAQREREAAQNAPQEDPSPETSEESAGAGGDPEKEPELEEPSKSQSELLQELFRNAQQEREGAQNVPQEDPSSETGEESTEQGSEPKSEAETLDTPSDDLLADLFKKAKQEWGDSEAPTSDDGGEGASSEREKGDPQDGKQEEQSDSEGNQASDQDQPQSGGEQDSTGEQQAGEGAPQSGSEDGSSESEASSNSESQSGETQDDQGNQQERSSSQQAEGDQSSSGDDGGAETDAEGGPQTEGQNQSDSQSSAGVQENGDGDSQDSNGESKPSEGDESASGSNSSESDSGEAQSSQSKSDSGDSQGSEGQSSTDSSNGQGESDSESGQGKGEAPSEQGQGSSEGSPESGTSSESDGQSEGENGQQSEAGSGESTDSEVQSEAGVGGGSGSNSADQESSGAEPSGEKMETVEGGGKDAAGQDGVAEGGGHLGQEIQDALRNLLEKKATEKSDLDSPEHLFDPEQDIDPEKYSMLDLDRLGDQPETEPNLNPGKSWEDALKEPKEKPKSKEDIEDSSLREDLKKLSSAKIIILIQAFVELAWERALGSYSNSIEYRKALTEFMSFANELYVNYPGADFLQQYAHQAAQYLEDLSIYEVEYSDLEDLGLSLIRTNADQELYLLRKAKYVDRIFSEISLVRDLSLAEQRLLDFVRKILGQFSLESDPSDKELGEAFYNLMQGPLSRSALNNAYPSKDPLEPMDWAAFANHIREGRLNDLVLFSRMAPFVDILVNEVYKPHFDLDSRGDFEPINEYDSVIEGTDDFEELPDVIKEGYPTEIEILRMLSGDALKNAYREPVEVSNPRKPKSNKVTIVLYDISGSMSNASKEVARNAIFTSFVDKSQLEVSRDEGTHTLYMIAFDGRPHQPERLGDIGQAQAYFDRMRSHPIGSGGDDSISAGMIKAFDLIAEHQENGGELERGNILLITDAIASIDFDGVQRARDQVDPEIDIALNAVTIGDWNSDVSKMIEKYAINSDGDMGKVSHQHIPYPDLERLLNVRLYLDSLVEAASVFNEETTRDLPNKVYVDFKDALIRVKTETERRDQKSSARVRELLGKLSGAGFFETNKNVKVAMKLFYRFAMSSLGDSWSQNMRAETFSRFIDIMADAYEVDREDIFDSLGREDRERIVNWLEN